MRETLPELVTKRGTAIVIATLVACLVYGGFAYYFNWVADDAFISFRYSKNLAAGDGLRFNVDEDPPVEGYSNFLWVLLMTPFELVGFPPSVASRIISFIAGLILIYRLTRFVADSVAPAFLPLAASSVFLGSLPPVVIWATSGLETMPVCLLLFLMFESLYSISAGSRGRLAAIAGALLVLIRADGAYWVAICIGTVVLASVVWRRKDVLRPLTLCAASTLGAVAAVELFRVAYFGELLPNTAHAKAVADQMVIGRGLKYAVSLMTYLPHLPLILAGAIVFAVKGWSNRSLVLQCVTIVVAAFAYAVLVGGDFMTMGRLLVPAMPFFAVLLAIVIAKVVQRPIAVAVASVAIAASLLSVRDVNVVPGSVGERLHFRTNTGIEDYRTEIEQWKFMAENTEKWTKLGRALKAHTRAGESLVRPSIGAVGYYTDLHIYDMFGLVDKHVARRVGRAGMSPGHDKFVTADYFLKFEPTYLYSWIKDDDELVLLKAQMEHGTVEGYGLQVYELPDSESTGRKAYLCLLARERP